MVCYDSKVGEGSQNLNISSITTYPIESSIGLSTEFFQTGVVGLRALTVLIQCHIMGVGYSFNLISVCVCVWMCFEYISVKILI